MSDRKYLHEDEIQMLRDTWRDWARSDRSSRAKYYWVFLVAFHTGARIREILTLSDSSFNSKQSLITLSRLKQRGRLKNSTKTIRVSESAMDEILTARLVAKGSGKITPAYITFYKLFKTLSVKSGISLPKLQHPHVLRHSYAMYNLNAGIDVNSVRKLLGNSSIQSVLVYLDKTPEDIGDELHKKGLLRD